MPEPSRHQLWAEELRDALVEMLPGCPVNLSRMRAVPPLWLCEMKQTEPNLLVRVLLSGERRPEYAVECRHGETPQYTFDTASLMETAAGTMNWMRNFPSACFVMDRVRSDAAKFRSSLDEIEAHLLKTDTRLASLSRRRVDVMLGYTVLHHTELHIGRGERKVQIRAADDGGIPTITLNWADFQMAEFTTDFWPYIARVIVGWVADDIGPLAMRQQFPRLTLSRAADFYADGYPVEGEFVVSWDQIEEDYRRFPHSVSPSALAFLASARAAGYDRRLRAGLAMWTVILSRSRRHGLRPHQPRLTFVFTGTGMEITPRFPGADLVPLVCSTLDLTPDVIVLLDRLASCPID